MPGPVFGNRIVDLELIVEAFAQLCCPKCFAAKVELFVDSRYGLCSHFTLKCKLTDNFIDRLQNYYGIAVRSNVGNLTAMQQNVIAALYHCASSDKKPMHGQCPIGKESWCYFQRGWQMEQNVPQKYAGLSNDVLNKN
ncbi:putative kolobok1-1 nv [Trichonephila clavipes]|nr:putative kolobok1-1 nv [Trichonephila clavipes]